MNLTNLITNSINKLMYPMTIRIFIDREDYDRIEKGWSCYSVLSSDLIRKLNTDEPDDPETALLKDFTKCLNTDMLKHSKRPDQILFKEFSLEDAKEWKNILENIGCEIKISVDDIFYSYSINIVLNNKQEYDSFMEALNNIKLPYNPSDTLKKIKGFKDFY